MHICANCGGSVVCDITEGQRNRIKEDWKDGHRRYYQRVVKNTRSYAYKNHQRWSHVDKRFLLQNWDKIAKQKLALKLGRTFWAIKTFKRKIRRGLISEK